MKLKLELLNCKNWEDLPDVWKVVKRIKPIEYRNDISDKNLLKIVQPYIGKDLLRPATTGAYVEKDCITVTDSTMLLNIPFKSEIPTGIYKIDPKSKNTDAKLYEKINENFPPYRGILPKIDDIYKFDALKLRTYLQAVINGKYANQVTQENHLRLNKDKIISVNSELMITVLDSFLLMGYQELYMGINRSACLISPNPSTVQDSESNIGKHPFAVLMQLYIQSEYLGSEDVDLGTGISVYYNFENDEIINSNGSKAKYDPSLSNTDLPYMDNDYFKLISKLVPKNPSIPITENVEVKNSKATVTDLEYFLTVKDVFLVDGIYEVVNGAFKNTEYDIDDFPKNNKSENDLVSEFNTTELAERFEQSTYFVGDDDLRPVMNGVSLDLRKENNQIKLFSTNSHILYRGELNLFDKLNSDKKFLLEQPKATSNFLNAVKQDTIKLFAKEKGSSVKFASDDMEFSIRLNDSPPINYEQVLDRNINTVIDFDKDKLLYVLKGIKGEDAKNSILFDFKGNKKNAKSFSLSLGKKNITRNEWQVVKDLNVSIDCQILPADRVNIKSMGIIMPITTDNENFAFNVKYLITLLSVSEGKFYFDINKENPQFQSKILDVEVTQKPTPKVTPVKNEPKDNKSEIQATIDALKFLADSGNDEAKATIEGLKFLI